MYPFALQKFNLPKCNVCFLLYFDFKKRQIILQDKIKLTSRLLIPEGVLDQPGLTRKQIEQEMRESRRADKASTYRPKNETADERKQRKQATKQERKVCPGMLLLYMQSWDWTLTWMWKGLVYYSYILFV